ncbi:hypothetical protein ACJX0J_012146, partial [Zea mays]
DGFRKILRYGYDFLQQLIRVNVVREREREIDSQREPHLHAGVDFEGTFKTSGLQVLEVIVTKQATWLWQ